MDVIIIHGEGLQGNEEGHLSEEGQLSELEMDRYLVPGNLCAGLHGDGILLRK